MGGKSGGDQVVGYWYAVGMHMVLCHGPVDAIKQIIVGDRIAWSGDSTESERIYIDQPELFGGEEREGGIQGYVDLMFGEDTQPCNDYLVNRCGGGPVISDPNPPPLANGLWTDPATGVVHLPDGTALTGYTLPVGGGGTGLSGIIPAFRGVLSLVLRQCWVSALNPYIKPWSARVVRTPKILTTGLNSIGTDANPAAMICECLTNNDWGSGHSVNELDYQSFITAAQTLKDEGFGMSLTWSKQQKMDEFIGHILSTVDGYRYSDPQTGAIGIRLARDDYDRATLLHLDESHIQSVSQFTRPDPADIINQVTVTFVERPQWGEKDEDGNPTGQVITRNVDRSITVHNGASIDLVGKVNPTTLDYPGIPNIKLASRVAMRELAARSRGLAQVKFVANRVASQLKCGDVFKMSWPPLGILGLVLRVTEVDYGLLTDGRITVNAVEDAFSLPATTYLGSSGSSWKEPVEEIKQIANAAVFEVPYYIVATQIAGDNDTALDSLPVGYGFAGSVAARPQNQATNYAIWDKQSGQYQDIRHAAYTPQGALSVEIDDVQESFEVAWNDLTNFVPNSYILVEDEWMALTGIDGTTVTVKRAVMDSIPAKHSQGVTVWLAGGRIGVDSNTYLAGQTARLKLQPRTVRGAMSIASVVERTLTFNNRALRPYPPGNVQVNGVYRPKKLMGTITSITWSSRNRLTQTASLIDQKAASIAPEANTFYSITLKERNGPADAWITIETKDGITSTSYTPTVPNGRSWLRIELKSYRMDGSTRVESYYTQILEIERAGWGVGYGNAYGGF